jgi:diguanylate cyclase (GGDEF)-like protein
MTLREITKISQTLNVLLVEDEKDILDITTNLLRVFFPNIDTATNGQEGLDKFKENDYDLVVTDIKMPKLNGIDMLNQIKAINPDIHTVILSAVTEKEIILETAKIGIDGYLFKPLVFEQFLNILEAIISKENINKKISTYKQTLDTEITTTDINNFAIDPLTQLETLPVLMNELNSFDTFHSPVVLLINIDKFSIYNQLYGLNAGNEILIKFTKILKDFNKNKTYKLFRINADEFVFLDQVEYLEVDKYENNLNELFSVVENTQLFIEGVDESIDLEITVGISFSSSQALKKANMALYEARRRGRNFIGFTYDIDYTNTLQSNLFWRKEIKNALAQNRVVSFYQPIVDRDLKVVQYESFIRIKQIKEDGEIEFLAPDEFLDLAILTKQYLQLTKFMIQTTLQKMAEKSVAIAINLTYQDIKNGDIHKILKETIQKYHLEDKTEFDISNNVIFEIIEHEGVNCYNTFLEFVNDFKKMGVKIALDDFGSGFSNFSHINALAPDFIKIDGALITSITESDKSLELVKAIIKFSKELNIKTIAEHVQSKEVFDLLYDLGVDKFQGFYFGRPQENIE